MQGVTIQDVAKAAGISPSSVSNFLNGRYNQMSKETCERIREVIDALGYTPSTVARQLKTGHTPMLGLLTPYVAHPYHGRIADALDKAAQRYGYRMILGSGNGDEKTEYEFINELVGYGIRGIVVSSELSNPNCIAPFIKRGIAFSLIDERVDEIAKEGIDVVNIDNTLSSSMAMDHLVELGHRRIAYVTPHVFFTSRFKRLDGYVGGLQKHNLGEPIIVGNHIHWIAELGNAALLDFSRAAIDQFLRLDPMPTAILALNDMVAISLLVALRERGIQVPEQVAMAGIDDIVLGQLTMPTLTSIRPLFDEMALSIIHNLTTRLENPKLERRVCSFAPELMVRQSSGSPLHTAANTDSRG